MPEERELLLSPIYSLLIEVENAIPAIAYEFTPIDDYKNLSSVAEFQLIYWRGKGDAGHFVELLEVEWRNSTISTI